MPKPRAFALFPALPSVPGTISLTFPFIGFGEIHFLPFSLQLQFSWTTLSRCPEWRDFPQRFLNLPLFYTAVLSIAERFRSSCHFTPFLSSAYLNDLFSYTDLFLPLFLGRNLLLSVANSLVSWTILTLPQLDDLSLLGQL